MHCTPLHEFNALSSIDNPRLPVSRTSWVAQNRTQGPCLAPRPDRCMYALWRSCRRPTTATDTTTATAATATATTTTATVTRLARCNPRLRTNEKHNRPACYRIYQTHLTDKTNAWKQVTAQWRLKRNPIGWQLQQHRFLTVSARLRIATHSPAPIREFTLKLVDACVWLLAPGGCISHLAFSKPFGKFCLAFHDGAAGLRIISAARVRGLLASHYFVVGSNRSMFRIYAPVPGSAVARVRDQPTWPAHLSSRRGASIKKSPRRLF